MTSPLVTSLEWGRIEVAGFGSFKDVLLSPGRAVEWDWRETGTRHVPGVLVPVVEMLLGLPGQAPEVVVLSQGVDGMLNVSGEALDWLEKQGIERHVALTPDAVALHNELAASRPVAAAIHSTC